MRIQLNADEPDRAAYRFESNQGVCLVDIDDQARLQLFSMDAGTESFNVSSEVRNGQIHLTLSQNEREFFSGLLTDLQKDLEAARALFALKSYFKN